MKKFILFGSILVFVGILNIVLSKYAETKKELSEVCDEYQTYRAAAQDAYSFALGDECEYGEQIPNEFFIRYMQSEPLSQEESYAIYKEAQRIVAEQLKTRGYNYRTVVRR